MALPKTMQNVDTKSTQNQKGSISIVHQKEIEPYWLLAGRDIFVPCVWPLTLIILVLIFRKPLFSILTSLGEFAKNLDEIVIKKDGVKIKKGETNTGGSILPTDPQNVRDLAPASAISTNKMIGRILSTMWYYQLVHFKDFAQRWSFTLGVSHPEYFEFINAIHLLISRGLVAQDKNSQQFYLTDFGIFYCKQNEAQLKEELFQF